MRLLKNPQPQLPYVPHACMITNRIDGDFIDFQKYVETPNGPHRLYVKREVVEEAAEKCGMVSGDEVATLKAELDQLGAQLDELKHDLSLFQTVEQRLTERTPE